MRRIERHDADGLVDAAHEPQRAVGGAECGAQELFETGIVRQDEGSGLPSGVMLSSRHPTMGPPKVPGGMTRSHYPG